LHRADRLRQPLLCPVGGLEVAVGDVVAVVAERAGAVRPVESADLIVGKQGQELLS